MVAGRASRAPVRRAVVVQAKKYDGGLMAEPGMKFGVVVARFNSLVTKALLEGAMEDFEKRGVKPENVDVSAQGVGWAAWPRHALPCTDTAARSQHASSPISHALSNKRKHSPPVPYTHTHLRLAMMPPRSRGCLARLSCRWSPR
jgi:hypothetical protein